MSHACARQLYQLRSRTQLHPGAYVAVNGPWDRFGTVVTSTPQAAEEQGDTPSFLNLIRGCPQRPGEKVIASF